MNYVERHFGDWARDTAHLSLIEDGAYNRLCDCYYVREQPLPPDVLAVCRLVRATSTLEQKAVRSVLAEFFTLTDAGWAHKRCDQEIERFRTKSGKAKASADARWAAQRTQLPPDMRTHQEGNATRGRGRARSHSPLPTEPSSDSKNPAGGARGSRLPPDWDPGEPGFSFASQQGLTNGRASTELAKFRDYWTAKAGSDATKTDWQATWRNWVRKAAADGTRRGSDPPAEQPALWHETRNGVITRSAQLGLDEWDEARAGLGTGPTWDAYRKQVIAADRAARRQDA